MSDQPVLVVQDLHKTFRVGLRMRAVPVLRGVNFTVQRGEILGFLGPNGAGKTTTIKSICNLIRPDKGSVQVLGGSFADPAVRVRVGVMPEHAYYHEFLTARELLGFHGRLADLAPATLSARIDELLELVGLSEAADRAIRKFSKGMLQRVGLAQALLARPDLVILDEPMSGLDPIGRRAVRDIIVSLKDQGTTVFFSTHILPDVELISDRVVILHQGQTVRQASTADLLKAATGAYDLELGGAPDDLATKLNLMATPAPASGPYRRWQVAADRLPEALALVQESDARLHRVEAQRLTLEEAFLKALEEVQA